MKDRIAFDQVLIVLVDSHWPSSNFPMCSYWLSVEECEIPFYSCVLLQLMLNRSDCRADFVACSSNDFDHRCGKNVNDVIPVLE